MFSVDNFYSVFSSNHAGFDRDNFLCVFQPHGSKNWKDLVIMYDLDQLNSSAKHHSKCGKTVMHDQEPVFLDNINTYRAHLAASKNHDPAQLQSHDDFDLLHLKIRSSTAPIICHSEKNSDDIEILKQHGFVDCYYWWHGMIARDWFRHWRYHKILSCQGADSKPYRFMMYCRDTTGTRQYRKTMLEQLWLMRSKIYYDWDQTKHVPSNYSATIDINDAQQADIQIVPETLFETGKLYLTEKVFKPMVMRQAFILLAPPGSLQYLRDYGFKTFSGVWDESYDTIKDHQQRMASVTALINEISALDNDQYQKVILACQDILDYNREYFYSERFQDLLINEMETNYNRALEQRQQAPISYERIKEKIKKQGHEPLFLDNPSLKQYQRHEHSLDDESSANGDDVK